VNIGYFNARGPNNGIENWFDLEIEELRKRGHEVRIFWLKGPQPTQEDRKWMDVAHYHFAHVAEHYKKLNIPFIVSGHANDIWLDQGATLKSAASHPKCIGVTYQSFYHKKKFEEWGIPGKLYYLPMSARVDLFKRQTPYNPSGGLVAGGRLIPKKGLDRLKGMENLTIFGDGPLKEDLMKMNPLCVFTGHLMGNQLRELFEKSSIYLFPSLVTSDGDSDGIANTLKEALLMELHVIASPVAGTPELCSIHLLSDWSERSFTNMVSTIPKTANTAGREEILSIYSPDKCVDRILEIINGIL
jgi:glycosyltransferase involved in cell wall biosynthesis